MIKLIVLWIVCIICSYLGIVLKDTYSPAKKVADFFSNSVFSAYLGLTTGSNIFYRSKITVFFYDRNNCI